MFAIIDRIYVNFQSNISINLIPKTYNHNKFSATSVYKLTCSGCGKAYIRQEQEISPKVTMNTSAPSEIIAILLNFAQNLNKICILSVV